MIFRTLTMIGGMLGAMMLSQFPEFTQQYTQRLGGQVEALEVVIADFDRSAERADMTRDEALASMGGSLFLENRRDDMRATITRLDRLSGDLAVLRVASPVERLMMPHRVADAELALSTWRDFVPALPLTLTGAISAAVGFALGSLGVAAVLKLICWPFRRKRTRKQAGLDFSH